VNYSSAQWVFSPQQMGVLLQALMPGGSRQTSVHGQGQVAKPAEMARPVAAAQQTAPLLAQMRTTMETAFW
jgi:hypothetical protein